MSKQQQAADLLMILLEAEPMKSTEVEAFFSRLNISERTLLLVKKDMGIRSFRKDGIWYWQLPNFKT